MESLRGSSSFVLTAVAALSAACVDPGVSRVELRRHRTWTAAARCATAPAKVDVLLVVDDSPSMAEEAEALGEALLRFAEVYEQEEAALDYRLAVISTHMSGPHCDAGPDGALQTRSCLAHLEDFEVVSSHESAPANVTVACERVCGLERVETLPTVVGNDPHPRARPWIERRAGVHNLHPDVTVPEALACLGSLGVAGCDRESPMRAVAAAVARFSDPSDPAYGFLRDEAGLAVLFIGDEDDCSLPSGVGALRGAGTTSARCWRSATRCDAEGCEAREGELWDRAKLVELLRSIEEGKQRRTGRTDQRVFVSAVAGVPAGWPDAEQSFAEDDTSAFGVEPGCVGEGHRATPVVRLRDLVSAFSPWAVDLVSVCESGWERALSCLPNPGPERFSPLCLSVPESVENRGDFDPATQCALSETRGGETVALPTCAFRCADETCSWSLPEGEEACVAWFSALADDGPFADLDPICADGGWPAEARVLRRDPLWEGSCVTVSCAYTE